MKIDILLGQIIAGSLALYIILYSLQRYTALDLSKFHAFPQSNIMALLGASLIIIAALIGWRKRSSKPKN